MTTYAGRAVLPSFFIDSTGNPQELLSITVYNRGTTVKPTLYTDRTKATTVPNPVATDALGNFFPYLDPGEYDALVGGTTIPFTVVPDPEDVAPWSASEKQLWQDRAALLDPDAYVFLTGAGTVCGPVPEGERWYIVNSWGVLSSINYTISASVTSGSALFTSAALTGTEGGLYVYGTGVAAGRKLQEASAGVGRLNANATAPTSTPADYQLFSTTYHRTLKATLDEARPMSAGTSKTICPFGGYVYVCKPQVVIDADDRYVDDPKALYYSRLAALRALPWRDLDHVVPPATAVNTINTKDFPSDFDAAMLMHVNCHDAAWIGLNSPTLGAINTMNEISDYHSVRFTSNLVTPFKRSTFPALRVAGGSILGTTQMMTGSGYGGANQADASQGGVSYVVLPEGW